MKVSEYFNKQSITGAVIAAAVILAGWQVWSTVQDWRTFKVYTERNHVIMAAFIETIYEANPKIRDAVRVKLGVIDHDQRISETTGRPQSASSGATKEVRAGAGTDEGETGTAKDKETLPGEGKGRGK